MNLYLIMIKLDYMVVFRIERRAYFILVGSVFFITCLNLEDCILEARILMIQQKC